MDIIYHFIGGYFIVGVFGLLNAFAVYGFSKVDNKTMCTDLLYGPLLTSSILMIVSFGFSTILFIASMRTRNDRGYLIEKDYIMLGRCQIDRKLTTDKRVYFTSITADLFIIAAFISTIPSLPGFVKANNHGLFSKNNACFYFTRVWWYL